MPPEGSFWDALMEEQGVLYRTVGPEESPYSGEDVIEGEIIEEEEQ